MQKLSKISDQSLSHNKKHFVFDFDDTLVNSRTFCGDTVVRVVNKLSPEFNSEIIADLHDQYRGMAIRDLYVKILSEVGLDIDIELALKLDAEIQSTEFMQLQVFEGVIPVLEFLKKKGEKLYICTNRMKKLLTPILEKNMIDKYFDEVVSCVDEGYKKPDPTCLKRIIANSGDSVETFVYFGDSEVDRDFAEGAGIDYIIFDQYLNNHNLFKTLVKVFL